MGQYLVLQAMQILSRKVIPAPGMAIGIIRQGKIDFARGFGLADIEKGEKVTPQTIFDLASCTKTFTALLAAIAVQEGRLDWDKPVKDYWPEFELSDPYITYHLTARDMACHRSGLGNHDLAFFNADFDRTEFIRRLKYLKFNYTLRERAEYQNQMIVALGVLLEKIYQCSWEALIREKIAGPLGIKASFRGEVVPAPYSKGYVIEKGKPVNTAYQSCSADNPCGGIKLSLDDCLKYLLSLLDGKFSHLTGELFKPHMYMGDSTLMPGESMYSYAPGWMVVSYRGKKIVRHAGIIDGFASSLTLIPSTKSGVVILTNGMVPALTSMMQRVAVDSLTGSQFCNYPKLFQNHFARLEAQAKQKESSEIHQTKCPLQCEEMTGEYTDPGYGTANVVLEEGKLRFIHPGGKVYLEHVTGMIFKGKVPVSNMPVWVEFSLNILGKVDQLNLYVINPAQLACVMVKRG